MSSVFETRGESYDPTYIALRDRDKLSSERLQLERMWSKYEPFADKNFQRELGHKFHSRLWEMYMANVLIDCGFKLSEERLGCGPDILTSYKGRRVWIEAIAPEPGNGPDRVPDRESNSKKRIGWATPEKDLILRLTNAISEKMQKIDTYLSKGIISDTDHVIIGINGGKISGSRSEILGEIPYFIQAVLPFGDEYVIVDVENNLVEHGYKYRADITKRNGSRVSTEIFLNPQSSNISTLLYSSADWSSMLAPYRGSEFICLHNYFARNSLEHKWLDIGTEYWIGEGKLHNQKLSNRF